MYIALILYKFEYVSVVGNNLSLAESNKLETISWKSEILSYIIFI
jgi:hypothetical protein